MEACKESSLCVILRKPEEEREGKGVGQPQHCLDAETLSWGLASGVGTCRALGFGEEAEIALPHRQVKRHQGWMPTGVCYKGGSNGEKTAVSWGSHHAPCKALHGVTPYPSSVDDWGLQRLPHWTRPP